MPRGILFIAGLTVLSAVFAQGQTANQSTVTPANGPFGGPLLVTPIASFPNPVPTAGISDTGRAGISISTSGAGTSNSTGEIESTVAPPLPESTNQTQVSDLGASSFVGGPSDASAPGTFGVAEASSRYKAEKAARNARVLDNEDVQKMLDNKNGVAMAKNMPPLGPGKLEQGVQAQNTGIQADATPTTTQAVQQNTPTAASPGQNQTAAPVTDAENSTTPQINPNQQSNDAQGSRRLPATATFLPLLGLLGVLSGGIGFWFRKFRK
jgi:hypothetical protein